MVNRELETLEVRKQQTTYITSNIMYICTYILVSFHTYYSVFDLPRTGYRSEVLTNWYVSRSFAGARLYARLLFQVLHNLQHTHKPSS